MSDKGKAQINEKRNDYNTGRKMPKNKRPDIDMDEVLLAKITAENGRLKNLLDSKEREITVKDVKIAELNAMGLVLRRRLEEMEVENSKLRRNSTSGRKAQEAITGLLRSRIKASDDVAKDISFRIVGGMKNQGFVDYAQIEEAAGWLMGSLAVHAPAETMSFLRWKVSEGRIELARVELALLGLISQESGRFLGEEVVGEAKALA